MRRMLNHSPRDEEDGRVRGSWRLLRSLGSRTSCSNTINIIGQNAGAPAAFVLLPFFPLRCVYILAVTRSLAISHAWLSRPPPPATICARDDVELGDGRRRRIDPPIAHRTVPRRRSGDHNGRALFDQTPKFDRPMLRDCFSVNLRNA